jgi:apolipoprotein D and lipocalin family protein
MSLRAFGLLAASAALAAGCASQPANRVSSSPLETVERVDLDRYAGRWYEIARLPNSFEENCEGVTADYARRADGLISVVNTCRVGSPSGKAKIAKGKARVVDTETNARLEVSFFGPFWGDYWIVDLAEDYSLAIVSEPKGRYLWVLSRTPTISDEARDGVLARLDALGFDASKLYFPQQPPL